MHGTEPIAVNGYFVVVDAVFDVLIVTARVPSVRE